MFDRMMEHFHPRIRAIKGNWNFGDNLEVVNALTGSGLPLETAARQGPTGRYAAAHGFHKVSVISATGVDGAYSWVSVLFET